MKNIKDKFLQRKIVKKTLEFEQGSEPFGKKLKNVSYWSLRIGGHRIIFEKKGNDIEFYRILPRKFKYRELR